MSSTGVTRSVYSADGGRALGERIRRESASPWGHETTWDRAPSEEIAL